MRCRPPATAAALNSTYAVFALVAARIRPGEVGISPPTEAQCKQSHGHARGPQRDPMWMEVANPGRY
jgi:hypothetical protein